MQQILDTSCLGHERKAEHRCTTWQFVPYRPISLRHICARRRRQRWYTPTPSRRQSHRRRPQAILASAETKCACTIFVTRRHRSHGVPVPIFACCRKPWGTHRLTSPPTPAPTFFDDGLDNIAAALDSLDDVGQDHRDALPLAAPRFGSTLAPSSGQITKGEAPRTGRKYLMNWAISWWPGPGSNR